MNKLIRFPNNNLQDPAGNSIPVVAVDMADGTYRLGTAGVNASGSGSSYTEVVTVTKIPQTVSVVNFTAATAGSGTYSANDAVHSSGSGAFEFANIVTVPGDTGFILKARLVVSDSTIANQFRLHLYQTAVTPIADNAPFTLLWANNAVKIGTITFNTTATEGAGSNCAGSLATPGAGTEVPISFKCAVGSTSIFGLLETLGALAPVSTLQYHISLMAEVS